MQILSVVACDLWRIKLCSSMQSTQRFPAAHLKIFPSESTQKISEILGEGCLTYFLAVKGVYSTYPVSNFRRPIPKKQTPFPAYRFCRLQSRSSPLRIHPEKPLLFSISSVSARPIWTTTTTIRRGIYGRRIYAKRISDICRTTGPIIKF